MKILQQSTSQEVVILPKEKKERWANHANIEYLSKEDIRILLRNESEEYYEMLFLFTYETAGRQSEVLSVKISDIDFGTETVLVPTLKQRTKKPPLRSIKLSERVLKMISFHIQENHLEHTDFVFSREPRGKTISRVAFFQRFQKLVLQTFGESYRKKSNPHVLRHSRAIHFLNYSVNGNIALLKKFLGHSNVNNTMIYLRFADKEMDYALDSLNDNIALFG